MAEIETYRCSDRLCGYVARLARGFPVWRDETPRELRTPVPSAAALPFVTRYRSESLCMACRSVVEIVEGSCAQCSSDAVLAGEQSSRPCPRCARGSLSLARLTVF